MLASFSPTVRPMCTPPQDPAATRWPLPPESVASMPTTAVARQPQTMSISAPRLLRVSLELQPGDNEADEVAPATIEETQGHACEEAILLGRVRVPVGLDLGAVLVNQHGLDVAERMKAVRALEASEPAGLHSAEGQGGIALGEHDVVDGHATGRKRACHAPRAVQVLGPDAGRQPVLGVVRHAD